MKPLYPISFLLCLGLFISTPFLLRSRGGVPEKKEFIAALIKGKEAVENLYRNNSYLEIKHTFQSEVTGKIKDVVNRDEEVTFACSLQYPQIKVSRKSFKGWAGPKQFEECLDIVNQDGYFSILKEKGKTKYSISHQHEDTQGGCKGLIGLIYIPKASFYAEPYDLSQFFQSSTVTIQTIHYAGENCSVTFQQVIPKNDKSPLTTVHGKAKFLQRNGCLFLTSFTLSIEKKSERNWEIFYQNEEKGIPLIQKATRNGFDYGGKVKEEWTVLKRNFDTINPLTFSLDKIEIE